MDTKPIMIFAFILQFLLLIRFTPIYSCLRSNFLCYSVITFKLRNQNNLLIVFTVSHEVCNIYKDFRAKLVDLSCIRILFHTFFAKLSTLNKRNVQYYIGLKFQQLSREDRPINIHLRFLRVYIHTYEVKIVLHATFDGLSTACFIGI